MAVAHVQSASHYDSGYWNSVSLSNVGQGNLLVMLISGASGQTVTGITVTAGTTGTWQSAGSHDYGSGSVSIAIWFCYHTGPSETVSAHPDGSAADAGYSLHEYSGVATASPQVGSLVYDEIGNGDASFATSNITGVPSDAVLVAMWASEYTDRTISWTGYTQRTNESGHIHKSADRIISAAGNYNCAGSQDSSGISALVCCVCFQGPVASSTPLFRRRMNILLRLCLSAFNLIGRCFK